MKKNVKEELAYWQDKTASLEKDIFRLDAEIKDWTKRIVNDEGISSDEDLEIALLEVNSRLRELQWMGETRRAWIEIQIMLLKG